MLLFCPTTKPLSYEDKILRLLVDSYLVFDYFIHHNGLIMTRIASCISAYKYRLRTRTQNFQYFVGNKFNMVSYGDPIRGRNPQVVDQHFPIVLKQCTISIKRT